MKQRAIWLARWFLIPIGGVIGFYVAFFFALSVFDSIKSVGIQLGYPVLTASTFAHRFTPIVGACAAPIIIGTSSVVLAPVRTTATISVLYVLGLLAAIRIGFRNPFLVIIAAVVGLGTAFLLNRKFTQRGT